MTSDTKTRKFKVVSPLSGIYRGFKRLWHHQHHRNAFIAGIGVLIFGHWLAFDTHHALHAGLEGKPIAVLKYLGVAVVALALMALCAWSAYNSAIRSRSLYVLALNETRGRRRVLILPISVPNRSVLPKDLDEIAAPVTLREGDVVLQGDLAADLAALDASPLRWNWQQLMRAIQGHPELERIYLVGSCNEPERGLKGSFDHLGACRAFLKLYLPKAEVLQAEKAVDFEDFQSLCELFQGVLDAELARETPDSDICIDVTGGQKPTSIAAASVTMSNEVAIQYVQTAPPYEARRFDVEYGQPPGQHH